MQESLRDLTGQTTAAASNLNSAAAEILASTQQQAAGAKQQAATVLQVTATMEELSRSGSQVSDRAKQVAAAVGSAEEAIGALGEARPDVISLDIRLPGMNGFELTRRVMSERPTPIVVVAAGVQSADLMISMRALEAGALSVVEKPVGATHADYEAVAERLCTQLAIMSEVKVIRQRRFAEDRAVSAGRPASVPPPAVAPGIVGVVASTGGPAALNRVLRALGPGFPLPVLTVQHIAATFLEGFAAWLGGASPLPVTVAREGARPEPGRVYLAPADRHLRLVHGRLRLDEGEAIGLQRPSGTALFESMARDAGAAALGVLLTDMGEDGAAGLLRIRQAGGRTIAEDESTAVVNGMPGTAVRLGAAAEVLPLPEIGARLVELASSSAERRR
jgi:two-component system chemotaxis response regulator CheB